MPDAAHFEPHYDEDGYCVCDCSQCTTVLDSRMRGDMYVVREGRTCPRRSREADRV